MPAADPSLKGCRFEPRCQVGQGNPRCQSAEPEPRLSAVGTVAACFFPLEGPLRATGNEVSRDEDLDLAKKSDVDARPVLFDVVDVVKTFRVSRESGTSVHLRAVGGVSLTVREGESLGIVGESGSGKTTLARILVGLESADAGSLLRAGHPTGTDLHGARRHRRRQPGEIQMIFQDPSDSLDPLLTVERLVAEPLEIIRGGRLNKYRTEVADALAAVGLPEDMMSRRASELSGGQRQRIAIARALTTKPRLLVADEAVASLDMSARGQVLNLLADIQDESNLTCLHISHDLSMVRNVCQRVAVMHAGRIVEVGEAEELFHSPRHPYTAGLISAIPLPDPSREKTRFRVEVVGELPDLTRPVVGCAYRSRCPNAKERCAVEDPLLVEHDPGHSWACHYPEPPNLGLDAAAGSARSQVTIP